MTGNAVVEPQAPGAAAAGPDATLWLVARLALASALLLAAAHVQGRTAVALLLPALEGTLRWVADDFEILRMAFVTERDSLNLAVVARLDHVLVLGGRVIVPDGTQSFIVASTTVGTVLLPLLAALSLALAWLARPLEMLLRLAIVAVLSAAVLLLDTPFSLAAWLWHTQLRQYEPERFSGLVSWNLFLNGGGRLALGLVAGALAIALASTLGRKR